jgi:hypothetical protein
MAKERKRGKEVEKYRAVMMRSSRVRVGQKVYLNSASQQ